MGTLKVILISVLSGMLGAFLFVHAPAVQFGATIARTTITNPWTFATGTTMSKTLTVTTTNIATSTVKAGCYQLTATSTSNPTYLILGNRNSAASSSFTSVTSQGFVNWGFGTCPNL